jgi:branched-chain amino acid transport system substrate-binding protein
MRVLGKAVAVTATGALLAACGGGPSGGGGTISDDKVVIAVLNDQSGVYADLSGKSSVTAVELAVADWKAKQGDDAVTRNIEVVSVDHQNKPDIANSKAQELYDRQGADVILDVPTSSAALAVANVAKSKQKLFIDIGAATTALEGEQCNRYTFHSGYNTYLLANGTGATVTKDGAKNWYIVYPDYAFGQDMQKSFTTAVQEAGGAIVQSDPAPFPNDNFSTYLLKAPGLSPKPQVLGTMQAGGDLVNLVKQYNEYRLKDEGIGLAVGLMFITDIHSLGVEALAGTKFTDPWYWNATPENRAWADRFLAEAGKRPSFPNAANYSAATQYLDAVQRAGTDKSDDVVAELEGHTFSDSFARNGTIRAEDHLLTHDVSLAQVKTPAEVTEPWDYEKILSTIPAAEAFQPASPDCKLG